MFRESTKPRALPQQSSKPRAATPAAAAPADTATEGMRLVLVVAAALIDSTGPHPRVLLAQRPEGKAMAGLWEFPGGKAEPGESPERALCRELGEELGIVVVQDALRPLTFASHTYVEQGFHLLMPLFECREWQGVPQGNEDQALAWVTAEELSKYAMPAADEPLIDPIRTAMTTER
jgi:8-oxo-dGTP diphosphatase